MECFFDISNVRTITLAGINHYKSPLMHPNRKLSQHDFIYMLDGKWKIGQENETFDLTSGDVLILSANRSHYGITPCSSDTATMFFHVEGLPSDDETDDSVKLCSLIKAKSNPLVKHYFEKVVSAYKQGEKLLSSVYFHTVLCELKNCIDTGDTLANQIRQFILFADGIPSNEEIARKFNISLKTAEQTFKRAFGKTMHQYILETKIETAKQYLIDFPNMRIYEISNALGFYDEFHFSKLFKKLVGVSPKEFRANF